MLKLITPIILLSLAFAACRSTFHTANNGPQMALPDQYWKLISLNGETVNPNGNQRSEAYITFSEEGNQVMGNSSCNNFSGTYELNREESSISFSPVMATKMACINQMELERKFFQALQKTHSYSIEGDILTLSHENGEALAKFKAAADPR